MRGRLPLLLALLALPLLPAASASPPIVRGEYGTPAVLEEPYDCAPFLLVGPESLAWAGPDGLLVRRDGATLLLNDTGFLHLTSSHMPSALSPDGRWLALAFPMQAERDLLLEGRRNFTSSYMAPRLATSSYYGGPALASCAGHHGFVVDLTDGTRTPLPGSVRGLVGGPGGLVVGKEGAALVYAWGAWAEYAKVPLPPSATEVRKSDGNYTYLIEPSDLDRARITTAPIHSVALSDDGRTLAVATYGSAVHLLDVATGAPVHPDYPAVHFGETQIAHVAFAPGGEHLAVAVRASRLQGAPGELHIVRVRGDGFGIVTTAFVDGAQRGLTWGPAGLAAAFGFDNDTGLLRLYGDAVNLSAAVDLRTPDFLTGPIAWSPDGARLAVPQRTEMSLPLDEVRLYGPDFSLLGSRPYPADPGPALYPAPMLTSQPRCCEGREGMMPLDTVDERYVPDAFGVLALAALAAPALLRRKD